MEQNNTNMEDNIEKLPSYDVRASLDDDEDDDNKSFGQSKKTDPKSKTPVLDTYSRDLTKMAEEGKLDPVVGREKEIERVSQILSRRKKNNPILIGEPGCVDANTLIEVRKVSDSGKHNVINY
jgi:ATP-dependent Clp protease ATP-binding subunit ClpC